MNLLKSQLPFLIILFLLGSCSNDDDANSDNNETSLVGTWTQERMINQDGEIMLTECDKQTFFEFFENEIFNFTAIGDNIDSTGCEIILQTSGNWEIVAENSIMFSNDEQNATSEFEVYHLDNQVYLSITDNVDEDEFITNIFRKN